MGRCILFFYAVSFQILTLHAQQTPTKPTPENETTGSPNEKNLIILQPNKITNFNCNKANYIKGDEAAKQLYAIGMLNGVQIIKSKDNFTISRNPDKLCGKVFRFSTSDGNVYTLDFRSQLAVMPSQGRKPSMRKNFGNSTTIDAILSLPCNTEIIISAENITEMIGAQKEMDYTIDASKETLIISDLNSLCGLEIKITINGVETTLKFDGLPNTSSIICDEIITDCTSSSATNNPCNFQRGPSYANYRLVYDLQCNQFTVFKRCKENIWLPHRRKIFRPYHNNLIDIQFFNYNPLRDSVGISYRFENLHQDNSDSFLQAIFTQNSLQKPAQENTETPPAEPENIAISDEVTIDSLEQIKESLKLLQERMKSLYQQLASSLQYNTDLPKILTLAKEAIVSQKFASDQNLKSQLLNAIDNYNSKIDAQSTNIIQEDEREALIKLIEEIQLYYDKIANPIYRSSTAPIQVKDFDKLHIQLKNKNQVLNIESYEFNVRGGWKVDFSTGVVLSNLRDFDYYFKKTRSVSVIEQTVDASGDTITSEVNKNFGYIVENRNNRLNWGVGAMAHFYPRTGIIVNFSFTLGALIQQERLNMLAGGSLILGRNQRSVISGGLSWGSVDRLKSNLNLGEEFPEQTDNNITTERVNQIGWFVGFSYNFAGSRLSQ